MCTLSLFRKSCGYKVYMNRDERHDRAPELPPQIITADNTIFGPLDPVSNGTWIAYNENGYWGCLLNGYFEQTIDPAKGHKSRGQILPYILSQADPLSAVENIDPSGFLSFRLLIGSAHSHKFFAWDGQNFTETPFHAAHEERAFFLSSSSWKQDEVIEIRKGLFENWIKNNPNGGDEMPDFHYSQDPNPETAPLMNRSYSGTKSITMMDIRADAITMSYWNAKDTEIVKRLKA